MIWKAGPNTLQARVLILRRKSGGRMAPGRFFCAIRTGMSSSCSRRRRRGDNLMTAFPEWTIKASDVLRLKLTYILNANDLAPPPDFFGGLGLVELLKQVL